MERRGKVKVAIFIVVLFSIALTLNIVMAANPEGPEVINVTANETKQTTQSKKINISGGRIATLNLTASQQNERWKAFVGWVNGEYTLDDAGGSTIYDWSFEVTKGRVYATKDSATIQWASIGCANTSILESENQEMNHNNTGDNITATFDDSTHNSFYVGDTFISSSSCPTLNTYENSNPQDSKFEEMALYDKNNHVVYATIMEDEEVGFDGSNYDFQMIVPEDGSTDFSGSTAYYLYVELGS